MAPPCSNRETRRVPIEGEPADVVTRIAAYDAWLARSARTFRSCCRPSTAAGTLLIGRDDSLVCGEHRQVEIENCGPARHLAPDDSRSQSPWQQQEMARRNLALEAELAQTSRRLAHP